MRTTLSINDQLLQRAKLQAAKSGLTLGKYVDEALRRSLSATAAAPSAAVELPVCLAGEPRPGVDLTSNAALFELAEEADLLS